MVRWLVSRLLLEVAVSLPSAVESSVVQVVLYLNMMTIGISSCTMGNLISVKCATSAHKWISPHMRVWRTLNLREGHTSGLRICTRQSAVYCGVFNVSLCGQWFSFGEATKYII